VNFELITTEMMQILKLINLIALKIYQSP